MGRTIVALLLCAGVLATLSYAPACKPTSPDPQARAKSSKASSKDSAPSINRPGGHRANPLDFAFNPGPPGSQSQKPAGVWTRFGQDMRLLQDPPANDQSPAPAVSGKLVFSDEFDRPTLGDKWRVGGGAYVIRDNALSSPKAHNNNVILQFPLPQNARIEFDAVSNTDRIDVKCSVYDDGQEHESGYVVLMGGWYNKTDMIIRGREHDHEAVCRQSVPGLAPGRWQAGVTYHWTIVRQGGVLSWYVDNRLHLVFDDPKPLFGPRNRYFSFSNWESDLSFDNLKIFDLDQP